MIIGKFRTPKNKWITANQYLALARKNECSCIYGHIGDAAWDGGPCMDEILTLQESDEKFIAVGERD